MATRPSAPPRLRRLNRGCGSVTPRGWINVDRRHGDPVDLVADVRDGLALRDGAVDYAVAIHVLQDLPYPAIEPALRELRRVLAPGGVLHLGLPDLDRAIDASLLRDRAYFIGPDADAASVGAKLVTQIAWYGAGERESLFVEAVR